MIVVNKITAVLDLSYVAVITDTYTSSSYALQNKKKKV